MRFSDFWSDFLRNSNAGMMSREVTRKRGWSGRRCGKIVRNVRRENGGNSKRGRGDQVHSGGFGVVGERGNC